MKLCIFQDNDRCCRQPAVKSSEFCEEHHGLKCISCGEQAEHRCRRGVFEKCEHCGVVRIAHLCDAPLCWKDSCKEKHRKAAHGKEQKDLWEGFFSNLDRGQDAK